jgi:guanylate cyclase
MWTWYTRQLRRLLALGCRPGDGEQERLRKAVLNIFGLIMFFGAIMEVVAASSDSDVAYAQIMAAYGLATAIGLAHFWRTGTRALLQRAQFIVIILIAVMAHYWYGGAKGSYGYVTWGSLAPLGALLLASRREALVWTELYCLAATGIIVAELGYDVPMRTPQVGDTLFLALGVPLGYVLTVVTLVYYFVYELDKARVALQHEHELLQREQERSERLLLNILPAAIADRLKVDPQTIADGFAEVSVLFADIVGFTVLSAKIGPEELVELLNRLFSAFDELADEHGVEKIKTIGDAYMAAAGLPEPRDDHAQALAAMAVGMLEAISQFNAETGHELDVRIGINTGPVVAGVIGRRKFIYDLWGDAVNTASRMESHGEKGRIQVSESTRLALGDAWRFESRGPIQIKGKGAMETFFLCN